MTYFSIDEAIKFDVVLVNHIIVVIELDHVSLLLRELIPVAVTT